MSLSVTPLSAHIGARITGVDLCTGLDPASLETIHGAWLEHLVLVFPGQRLSTRDQARFCTHFGALEPVSFSGARTVDEPHVMLVSNVESDRWQTTLPRGEIWFHSDRCYCERPSSATTLYALEVPKRGGHTLFVNGYRAYETLAADLKRRLRGLRAMNVYDYERNPMTVTREPDCDAPRFSHPVVRTHPVTGRKSLYVNRLMTRYIEGLDGADSRHLLTALLDHAERPELLYEHRWRPGDLVMWDNRCTMHARTDFDPTERRTLRRMTVAGDGPV